MSREDDSDSAKDAFIGRCVTELDEKLASFDVPPNIRLYIACEVLRRGVARAPENERKRLLPLCLTHLGVDVGALDDVELKLGLMSAVVDGSKGT